LTSITTSAVYQYWTAVILAILNPPACYVKTAAARFWTGARGFRGLGGDAIKGRTYLFPR
jgi:hypothetical protein